MRKEDPSDPLLFQRAQEIHLVMLLSAIMLRAVGTACQRI